MNMVRSIGAVVAGLVVWAIVVTVLNLGLRYGMPGYAAVEKAMLFTVPMMAARLSISAVSSLASGYAAAAIGRRQMPAIVAGVIMLLLFIPVHYSIWDKFPIWYHLTFLTSLPVLSALGGRLRGEA
jgi:hypothetical protein